MSFKIDEFKIVAIFFANSNLALRSCLSIKLLRAFDKIGWIPGPEESERAFKLRLKRYASHAPRSPDLQMRAANRVWNLFKTRPKGYLWRFERGSFMCPWRLGYFQSGGAEEADTIVIKLQRKGPVWGYSFEEVLAHELTHAARSAFPADLFDEFLCCKTSRKWYRRVLGPYFSSFLNRSILWVSMISCWLQALLPLLGVNVFFEQSAWRLTLIVLTLQLLTLVGYLAMLALFLSAESKLSRAFGEMGSWWLFRLTQKEALSVAWKGVEQLSEFQGSDSSSPRDRLFADQLRSFALFAPRKRVWRSSVFRKTDSLKDNCYRWRV